MDTVLPTFKQYVSCPTREERTLDLMYANIKDAYISSSLPPSGQVRSQPGSPQTLLCASGEEEAYDHKDCEEVVGGGS